MKITISNETILNTFKSAKKIQDIAKNELNENISIDTAMMLIHSCMMCAEIGRASGRIHTNHVILDCEVD